MSAVIIRKAAFDDLTQIVPEIFEAFSFDLQDKEVFIKPNLVRPAAREKIRPPSRIEPYRSVGR